MTSRSTVCECDHRAREERAAPPDDGRASPERLARDVEAARESPIVRALLRAAESTLLVLNPERQIVAATKAEAASAAGVEGLRPGEAFGCVNAQDGGCGASPACTHCGALGAILASWRTGEPAEAQCLMRSAGDGRSFEFSVRATPIELPERAFTALTLRDVSSDKRREALEQIFFHDVLNTVAGLRLWSERLLEPETDHGRAAQRVDLLSRKIERELRDQRDLVLAENGTLTPSHGRVSARELLQEVEAVMASDAGARDRRLTVRVEPPALELRTDAALLLRVLVNMVRNAVEATGPGAVVAVRADTFDGVDGPRVRFSVHNATAIPPEVQPNVFTRSFSTKGGRGRGLGTYSMKLLGERYLGGEVSFESTPEAGTTFWIALPPEPARAHRA